MSGYIIRGKSLIYKKYETIIIMLLRFIYCIGYEIVRNIIRPNVNLFSLQRRVFLFNQTHQNFRRFCPLLHIGNRIEKIYDVNISSFSFLPFLSYRTLMTATLRIGENSRNPRPQENKFLPPNIKIEKTAVESTTSHELPDVGTLSFIVYAFLF